MINSQLKLSLKFNKLLTNVQANDAPFTPVAQTISTPVEQLAGQQGGYFGYQNPQYNESDDILPGHDLDTKVYTLSFTNEFDQMVLSVYSDIVSRPTTTPFSGVVPPLGIALIVSNETLNMIRDTNNDFFPCDTQSIMTPDVLRDDQLAPVFLQLIRKRLIELCISHSRSQNPPNITTVTVSGQGKSFSSTSKMYNISNLSLNELNISNYNSTASVPPQLNRLRLRLLKLSRHNSNTWLHVGNISSIKNANMSTDSFTDYVPQLYINRLANSCGLNSVGNLDCTPPQALKPPQSTPPQLLQSLQQQLGDLDEFTFFNQHHPPARLPFMHDQSPRLDPESLVLRTSLIGGQSSMMAVDTLDLPFMLTIGAGETGYFSNGFQPPPLLSLNNVSLSPLKEENDKVGLPYSYSLSEKKRDSLKMKRGIH
ncbi:hypothetical protein JNB11_01895 [Kocuria palustris]|nr:hypothetical protein [Kocuria palustris]